jgi:hypothetical protein
VLAAVAARRVGPNAPLPTPVQALSPSLARTQTERTILPAICPDGFPEERFHVSNLEPGGHGIPGPHGGHPWPSMTGDKTTWYPPTR